MGEIPHSEKMFHLPIEVSVYVPSTQDVDKVVSKSEMKLRVDEVKKYLATLFGGFSSSSVEGGFLASDGKLVKENVERVVSFAPKEDFDKNKEALVQKASEWATKWGQEAIGLEHEGDLYYVPQKFENGGTIAIREAKEMANSQALEIKHHASELANALKGNPTIEAWVIAKLERASNDLADVTHYLEGRVKMSGKKMANGGSIEPKSNEVQFIKYRDEEIMYDPIFQEFFVNDVMFKTLQEARVFIDKGAPMSDEIKDAYRRGIFKKGGNMEFERPTYQSNYVASQDKSDYVDISDENWNTDIENDPVYKAQQSIKEKAKNTKELATRAGMAYITRGASEMGGAGKSMGSKEKVALGTEGEPNSGNKLSELASLLGKK